MPWVWQQKSSYDESDINAQRNSVLRHFAQQLRADLPGAVGIPSTQSLETGAKRRKAGRAEDIAPAGAQPVPGQADSSAAAATGPERFLATTGNTVFDQFEPLYFGVAFEFIFKYCTGMPDMPALAEKTRYRREAGAPRMEPGLWVRVMARRVEGQVG